MKYTKKNGGTKKRHKKGNSIAGLSKKVNAMSRRLAGETKIRDQSLSVTVVNTGVYALWLNDVGSGTGDNQRTGELIRGKYVRIKYMGTLDTTNGICNTIKMSVVIDKKPALGGTGWGSVYSSQLLTAMPNKDNEDRYTILKEVTINLSSNGGQRKSGTIYIPLKGLRTFFSSASTSSFTQGAIFLVAQSDTLLNPPTLLIDSRYAFYN